MGLAVCKMLYRALGAKNTLPTRAVGCAARWKKAGGSDGIAMMTMLTARSATSRANTPPMLTIKNTRVKNQKPKPKALLWRKTKPKTPSGELNVQLPKRQRQKQKNK